MRLASGFWQLDPERNKSKLIDYRTIYAVQSFPTPRVPPCLFVISEVPSISQLSLE